MEDAKTQAHGGARGHTLLIIGNYQCTIQRAGNDLDTSCAIYTKNLFECAVD
jgi:hypothetical protein